jgi:6-phosphogluconolactonase
MTQTNHIQWHRLDSIESLRHQVCDEIVLRAAEAIVKRGQFSIVLAGGHTPRAVYRLLRDVQADWGNWHIYHGDERCLAPDHADRNSLMARQAWLQYVPIPESQIHDIPAELGPVEGARVYAQMLQDAGTFDVVLLGLGEDGHTASLFPGQEVNNTADAVPVFHSPKPPLERVSLSQQRLNNSREVLFLVTGAGKQEAVDNWRSGVAIPASLILPKESVEVFCYEVDLDN